MGKKLKKKAPKKKKSSQKNYDSGRIDWGLCGRSSSDSESDSESFQSEDKLFFLNKKLHFTMFCTSANLYQYAGYNLQRATTLSRF